MHFEFLVFVALLFLVTPLLGRYLAALFNGRLTFLSYFETFCYRISGINPNVEMSAFSYAKELFFFNFLGFLLLFFLLIFQAFLPLNPENLPNVSWPLAFNIASSFVTNTNWQSYTPETTLSYFSQMVGLTTQNFLSAATGLVALVVLIRGITRKKMEAIGNFWVDLTRSLLYLFLPLALLFSLFLVSQGVIQNFAPYVKATTLEGASQTLGMGPVASQEAIKQLGTNGGGFFNANSAHPFENPNGLTNFFETFVIIMIPAALLSMYGIMIGSKKQGWLLFFVMLLLWLLGFAITLLSEHHFNPVLESATLLEGKETRFGVIESALWSVSTTATANGSINAQLSSLSPLAGGVALFNIMLGELIFGGVGVGLISMLSFVFLTVFVSGLMVGRTPEYFGKKIERQEILWVIVALFAPCALILVGAGISCILPTALSSLSHTGPHGLTEILYAFSSAAGNNGSAFAGLNANTDYYNLMLGVIMIITRVTILYSGLAIAGLLAKKKIAPASVGTFSANSGLFALLLLCVILIIGALTFFPAISLGPIIEHLLMLQGRTF